MHAGHIVDDVTIDDYIQHTRIDEEGTWGSQTEIYVLARMTGLNIFSFNTHARRYAYILPGDIDQAQYPDDLTHPAIYIQYTGNHFNVTLSQGSV